MLQRSTVIELAQNRFAAMGTALAIIAVASVAAITGGSPEVEELTRPGPAAEQVAEPEAEGAEPETTGGPAAAPSEEGDVGSEPPPPSVEIPEEGETLRARVARMLQNCDARPSNETGVSDGEITIGQIVTDSNQIPQQFRPAHEGLQAFVNLANEYGGVCGRRLKLEYRNDQFNPAIHTADFRELANRVLAFVGNESVFDQLDYRQRPPFEPTVRGDGSFVPDVGGLAFSYYRSQSAWHAGVIGSVSPTLVGGGQYRFLVGRAADAGTPCRKAGVVYLQEPTGASEDQARVGAVSLEADWGGGLGRGNVELYSTSLLDSLPAYEALVSRMSSDGMNCVFAYFDMQSSINLAKAMSNRGLWPPSRCNQTDKCFRIAYIPLAAYDQKFIQDAGDATESFNTFIPHVPVTETGSPAVRDYLEALRTVSGATPSTFSLIGFASGLMFVEGLQPCREAPTRSCLMQTLRGMEDFTAGGLLGGTTPFRTTRATIDPYGTFDWKHIFNQSIAMQVERHDGNLQFRRINPPEGFLADTIRVARGSPG